MSISSRRWQTSQLPEADQQGPAECFVHPTAAGDLGDAASLDPYLGVIRDIEKSARRAVEKGTPAAEAAAEYEIPESLGEWMSFSPDYFERAFRAWERELTAKEE